MARIAGVDIPRDKRVEVSVNYSFGLGSTLSRRILSQTGVNPDTRVRDLTEVELSQIREVIDKGCRVEGTLRQEVNQH